ncbi:hypothetical protein B0H14DRAFT_3478764 [Mycena olivaceomarginata]|nr:hypothetical protein B0H14DRAFT_3478764 [Mycena olivaceomarginata]
MLIPNPFALLSASFRLSPASACPPPQRLPRIPSHPLLHQLGSLAVARPSPVRPSRAHLLPAARRPPPAARRPPPAARRLLPARRQLPRSLARELHTRGPYSFAILPPLQESQQMGSLAPPAPRPLPAPRSPLPSLGSPGGPTLLYCSSLGFQNASVSLHLTEIPPAARQPASAPLRLQPRHWRCVFFHPSLCF